jgi:ATP-dependent DNA ligase
MTIKPMLARPAASDVVSDGDWSDYILEPKHDGMRCIIERTEDGIEIYSRTGKSQLGKCPALEETIMEFPVGTVLDGELVIISHWVSIGESVNGYSTVVPVVDFNKTMRVMGSGVEKAVKRQDEFGPIELILFDLPRHGGPQSERLIDVAAHSDNLVHPNPIFDDPSKFSEIHQELMDAGIEGSILKHQDALYEEGGRPRNAWYKIKKVSTYDVVVTGVYEGEGKHEGRLGGLIYSAFDDGELVEIGRVGGGLSDELREEFWKNKPLAKVIEVKANELVGSGTYGTPRHPQFVCVRIDKLPSDCTIDQFTI